MGRSAFVAGLFAVHPLHVESVAWVASGRTCERVAVVVTIWAYVGYARRPQKTRYAMVLLCFTLALMAKPMVMTLPLVLLLLDYWPLGRLRSGPVEERTSGREAFAQLPLPALVKEELPLAALAVAVGAATYVRSDGREPWADWNNSLSACGSAMRWCRSWRISA